ncbi:PKD domain-containing protein [Pseudoalteromonas rubra]|uniref:PKD domain-containing protein n=1 Tax=Pseudoalteromonas rubra TaxID=43658 RepID=UPI000F78CB28|nr:hypothetical protein [Pseudoalteromonas rubra]
MDKLANFRWKNLALASAVALALTGCGGGSDDPVSDTNGEPTPPSVDDNNQAPEVSIADVAEQFEQNAFTLTATASDADGSIADYTWSHNSPLQLSSTDTNSASPSYTVPDITEDTTITFSVTVTDDKGATHSASKAVLIKRNVNSVTLTGIVTDKPIANANITVSAGESVMQTTAGNDGSYQATLTVDESEANRPVSVTALGIDGQSQVKFVSVLNSVAQLEQQAGEDGVLDKEENFGVNITNVTTAEYALMTRSGASLTTNAELEQALLNVDADEKITLAALIKIVVDNDEFSLPDGVSSTLDLVDDEQTAQQFADDVNEADPDLIEQTKAEMKNDSNLIDDSIASLSGEFILQTVKHYNAKAYHINLDEAGTGSMTAINTVEIDRWQQENNKITIELKQPLHIFTPQNNTIQSDYIESLEMTILAENDVFRTVDVIERGNTVVTGDNPTTEIYEASYTSNLLSKQKTAQPEPAELLGIWYLQMNDSDGRTERDPPQKFEFKADGQLVPLDDPDDVLTWKIVDNSLVIEYQEDESSGTINFWLTKKLGAGYQFVSLDSSEPQWPMTEFGLWIKEQEDASWTTETMIGRWHGFIGLAQDRFDMDLFASGDLFIDTFDYHYSWRLTDGIFYRERFKLNGELIKYCDVALPNCHLETRVTHQLVAAVDDHYYLERQFEHFDDMGGQTMDQYGVFIYRYSASTAQNVFYPRNLDGWHVFWVKDEGSASWSRIEFGSMTYTQGDGKTVTKNELYINGSLHEFELVDGRLQFTKSGVSYQLALLEYTAQAMRICLYETELGCQEQDQQTWYYQPTRFTLTASADEFGQVFPVYQKVVEGESASFYIQPEPGYMASEVTGCNGQLNGQEYFIGSVTESCDVSVVFAPLPELQVTSNTTTGGSLSPLSQMITQGNTAEISVASEQGYVLDHIFGCNGTLEGAQYVIPKVMENCTVEAYFKAVDIKVDGFLSDVKRYYSDTVQLTYNADQNAQVSMAPYGQFDAQWSESGEVMVFVPQQEVSWTAFEYIADKQVKVTHRLDQLELSLRGMPKQFNFLKKFTRLEDDVEVNSYVETQQLDYVANTEMLTPFNLAGTWSVAGFDPNQPTLNVTFNDDGTGQQTVFGRAAEPISWSVTGDQLRVERHDGETKAVLFYVEKQFDVGYQIIAVPQFDNQVPNKGLMIKHQELAPRTAQDYIGRWRYIDGVELDEENFAMEIFANADQPDYLDIQFGAAPTSFQGRLKEGQLIRSRYIIRDGEGNLIGYERTCPQGNSCDEFDEMEYQLVAVSAERHYLVRNIFFNGDKTNSSGSILVKEYTMDTGIPESKDYLFDRMEGVEEGSNTNWLIEDSACSGEANGNACVTINEVQHEAELKAGHVYFNREGIDWELAVIPYSNSFGFIELQVTEVLPPPGEGPQVPAQSFVVRLAL